MSIAVHLVNGWQEFYSRQDEDAASPILRLFTPDGLSAIGHRSTMAPTANDWIYTWMGSFARLGESGMFVVDEDGNISVQDPIWVASDANEAHSVTGNARVDIGVLDASLDLLGVKVNEVIDTLITQNVFQPIAINITPEPATAVAKTYGPSNITPAPATAVARTAMLPRLVSSAVARTRGPAVQIGAGTPELRISPEPATAGAGATMHIQWVPASPATCVASTVDPTVVIT